MLQKYERTPLYRHLKQQPDWSHALCVSRAGQFIVLSLLVLLGVGLPRESCPVCHAAAFKLPSGEEVNQNDPQQRAPKATPRPLPTTATPRPAEYYEKLKRASKHLADLNSAVRVEAAAALRAIGIAFSDQLNDKE